MGFGCWWWGTIRKSAEQHPGITADRRLRLSLLEYTGKIIGYKFVKKSLMARCALLVSVLNGMPNSWNIHDWYGGTTLQDADP